MAKTALLFPGQGSQYVGMGHDLAQAYPQAQELFSLADQLLGYDLSRLCHEGPAESLDATQYTQPAVFVTSLGVMRAMQAEAKVPPPSFVAGHSLGELTALVAAQAVEFADGLRLVRERGRLMALAGAVSPGRMAAVLKLEDSEVERACRQAADETGKPVQVANYNAPGQVVISGDTLALERAVELLRERGAKRIVPLAVSIAAHSPLMACVAREYRAAVDSTPIREPQVPVVGNISARPLASVSEIRDELAAQLTWPVRWTASVQWMAAQGVTRFVEIGPKDVLAGLVRKIVPDCDVASLGDAAAIREFSA